MIYYAEMITSQEGRMIEGIVGVFSTTEKAQSACCSYYGDNLSEWVGWGDMIQANGAKAIFRIYPLELDYAYAGSVEAERE